MIITYLLEHDAWQSVTLSNVSEENTTAVVYSCVVPTLGSADELYPLDITTEHHTQLKNISQIITPSWNNYTHF